MLELRSVTKVFKMGEQTFHALKGIDLIIKQGELLAIVGPSGSGKTTTMNIIGLLDRPTTGKHLLDGQEVSKLGVNKRAHLRNLRIGFIFQSFMLLPRLNALQNVSLPLLYRGVNRGEMRHRSLEMLEKMGIGKHWHHHPTELSGGQQQRVAIARALVGNPSIILADEPTGALDTKTGAEVLALLKKINQEEGATIIIITHDLEVAVQCPRVIHVRDGLIEEQESAIQEQG
ncbi:MAG: macrolide ABC transporter ATP-binding protein [Coxiella sp. RIFCSPHIGHO2_12_FULL_42_15]|nr:MAG: macrolide ABC transporter ATP-binding protein [Coxiella sp. RIFCSPHIGHO2_12_FULL_42_15]